VQANGDIAAELAAIVALDIDEQSYDVASRVYPLGSGNSGAALGLRATTQTAPAGYTLDAANNYIESDAAVAAFGDLHRRVDFKDIRPLSGTDADVQAAADMLFDSALYWLQQHEEPATAYRLAVAGCDTLLRPLQTVRLAYRDPDAGIDLDDDLYILEATWSGDADGVATAELVVADTTQWPASDTSALVDSIVDGQVYQVHPQLNANSYVMPFTKHLDNDEQAEFRFRFDAEVVQLVRCTFDFQILALESTVKSVSSVTVTSASGGGATSSTAAAHSHDVTLLDHSHTVTIAAHTHGVTLSNHSHTVTIAAHTHDVTLLDHSHTVTIAAHTHGVTLSNHSHTVTIAAHTHGVTLSNHSHTVTLSAHTHDVTTTDHTHTVTTSNHDHNVTLPEHAHGVPDHQHRFRIIGGNSPTYPIGFSAAGTAGGLVGNASGSDYDMPTNANTGSTTTGGGGANTVTSASGGGQTVSSAAGGGQTVSSAAGGGQTVTSAAGGGTTVTSAAGGSSTPTTSAGGGTTVTSAAGGSSTPTTSAGGGTTVTSAAGGSSTPTTSAGGGTTETSSADGTHSHTVPAHTHEVTPEISMEYGIFRDDPEFTFDISDLEYSVDGATWYEFAVAINGFAVLGDSWYRIDITDLLVNQSSLRPLNSNNLLRIRRTLPPGVWQGDRATIDAQLNIRTIIQAVALTN
jgi:hypothetical protein